VNKHNHFSEKLYIFPESFHALRIELQTNWPNLWNSPLQYLMWADQASFIETLCEALGIVMLTFDSANLDGYSKQFLDALRTRRGLSALHSQCEYYPDQLRNTVNDDK
jgi:hypothetical protein